MVFKHGMWVGIQLTWEPVKPNNLKYFMYKHNNVIDLRLLLKPFIYPCKLKKATDWQIVSYWHLLNFRQHLTAENCKCHFELPAGAATGY